MPTVACSRRRRLPWPCFHADGGPWGLLAVGQRRGEPLTVGDLELLNAITREASLAHVNRRLFDEVASSVQELQARAVQLQESRQRLVAAQDEERRRIERDLHDGAQHDFVALAARLRQLAKGPPVAKTVARGARGRGRASRVQLAGPRPRDLSQRSHRPGRRRRHPVLHRTAAARRGAPRPCGDGPAPVAGRCRGGALLRRRRVTRKQPQARGRDQGHRDLGRAGRHRSSSRCTTTERASTSTALPRAAGCSTWPIGWRLSAAASSSPAGPAPARG